MVLTCQACSIGRVKLKTITFLPVGGGPKVVNEPIAIVTHTVFVKFKVISLNISRHLNSIFLHSKVLIGKKGQAKLNVNKIWKISILCK